MNKDPIKFQTERKNVFLTSADIMALNLKITEAKLRKSTQTQNKKKSRRRRNSKKSSQEYGLFNQSFLNKRNPKNIRRQSKRKFKRKK